MKKIEFVDDALDDLADLSAQIAARILKKIESFADGNSADVKKLTNREEYRLRVGARQSLENI